MGRKSIQNAVRKLLKHPLLFCLKLKKQRRKKKNARGTIMKTHGK